MTMISRKITNIDDLDRLVDEALLHPDRAARIKEMLHRHLQDVRVRAPLRSPAANTVSEDIWDNLPV